MSWPIVKLGDVFDISSSKRVHQKDWRNKGVPFYRAREVVALSRDGKVNNELFIDESMYEEYKSKFGVPKEGDLLVTAVGTLGQTYAVKSSDRFYFKDASVIWLSKKANVDTSYIQHALASPSVQRFIQNSSGATVGTYTISKAKETEIPLPPLAEQKRIAAILDKADALRRKRQQAIELADQFLRSVFLDMFGDPVTNPKGWPLKKLETLAECQLGKMLSQKAKSGESPKKYLRNANVRWGHFELDDLLEMDFSPNEQIKFSLKYGDLLVCEGGDVGRCAIWREQLDDCYFQKALHRVRVGNEILPEYLQEYFYWMGKCGGFSQSVSEVTFSHLTSEKIKQLDVPVPPLSLQEKFAGIFAQVTQFEKQAGKATDEKNHLFNSLSQKVFSGEL